jgi:hypothetical protein
VSHIRPKRKQRKVLWRTGRVIEDQKGMATLRSTAFHRCQGRCECKMADSSRKCSQRVTWFDGHLHHIVSRAHGGSDVISNVAFVTRQHHRELTGLLHWSSPAIEEWAR